MSVSHICVHGQRRGDCGYCVLSRQIDRLERDLTAARAEVERLSKLMALTTPEKHELECLRELMRNPKRERDALRAEVERLSADLQMVALDAYQGVDPMAAQSRCREILMPYVNAALAAKETTNG